MFNNLVKTNKTFGKIINKDLNQTVFKNKDNSDQV